MDSNFLSYDNWLNTSENYTSQEENLDTISACLAKVSSKVNTKDSNQTELMENKAKKIKLDEELIGNDYSKMVEAHESFHRFIEKTDFNSYMKNCTVILNSGNASSDEIESSQTSMQHQDEEILFKIASALSNPLTIDLISKLILSNQRY
jgi:cellobiose-specific phosphotransferase system component IIA